MQQPGLQLGDPGAAGAAGEWSARFFNLGLVIFFVWFPRVGVLALKGNQKGKRFLCHFGGFQEKMAHVSLGNHHVKPRGKNTTVSCCGGNWKHWISLEMTRRGKNHRGDPNFPISARDNSRGWQLAA